MRGRGVAAVVVLLVVSGCEPESTPAIPRGTPGPVAPGPAPVSRDDLLERARDLLAEKRYAEASAQFRRMLRRNEKDAEALRGLADVSLQMGDGRSALEFAMRTVELNQDDPEALNLLGVTLVAVGRKQEAARIFDRALTASPKAPGILINAALCRADLEEWKEADDFARRASECLPASTTPHAIRGRFLVRQKRHAEAIPHFQRALALAGEKGTAHYRLGKALLKVGRTQEGWRSLRAALETNPPDTVRKEINALLAEK